jgi:polysaccharide export outer membrane protein
MRIKYRGNDFRVEESFVMRFFILIAALMLSADSVSTNLFAQSQETRTDARTGASVPRQGRAVSLGDGDYRIGPGDVLDIQIDKAPELSGSKKVSSRGTIRVDFVGELEVARLTAEEVEKQIADRLRGAYLVNPQVKVAVTQPNSRSFFIQGSVNNPGVYQIEGRLTILTLISLAGGLDRSHGSTAFIIRELKTKDAPPASQVEEDAADRQEVPEHELLKVNIDSLYKGAFDQNILLEPRDIVHIPATEVFFVTGEVRKPGSFPLKEGTTLKQAISLAEGTTFQAKSNGIIFRQQPKTGKQEEIKIEISAVMSGKKEDIIIQPNDVVVIPNSKWKSVGGTILRTLGFTTLSRGAVLR